MTKTVKFELLENTLLKAFKVYHHLVFMTEKGVSKFRASSEIQKAMRVGIPAMVWNSHSNRDIVVIVSC